MDVDIGNALGTQPGLTEATLDRLDDRVAAAHETITAGMADEAFGYASLCLPETCPLYTSPSPRD